MNFAGAFLGLLLLALGAVGFLLSARVSGLARTAEDPALGFAGAGTSGTAGVIPPPEQGTTYLAVSTEPPSVGQRALALVGIAVLILVVSTASAIIVWNAGSLLIQSIFDQFVND